MTIKVAGTDIIDQSRNIVSATLKNYTETVTNFGNIGASQTLDLSTASIFTGTISTAGSPTLTIQPGVSGATGFLFFLQASSSGYHSVSWAAPVGGTLKWTGGSAPSSTGIANRTDVWSWFTPNGTTWYGDIVLFNYA